MRQGSLIPIAMSACFTLAAGSAAECRRPVHTYSIVARDNATGQLGVAVQSHYFSVGSTVTWAEAGVGAIATQSFVEPAYGPRGLELMRSGLSAGDALRALIVVDEREDVRQVAFVDANGGVSAHTGSKCIASAGQRIGDGYSVQANMMLNDKVVPAMAEAYENATGDFADRLWAALDAAERAGGDIRGSQSAAILIVEGQPTGQPWKDRVLDLRVEDHPDPITELQRLISIHRAYAHMDRGDVAMEKMNPDEARREYGEAAKRMPGNPEIRYWSAITLATSGNVEEALPLFRKVFAENVNWVELTRRLQAAGIIPDTPEGNALLERILKEAP